jgi:hypothetical protein
MLSIGKLLTEEQGRLTVRRVLSVDGGSAKVETTWESDGTFNGVHYTDPGTLWSFIHPDGTLYGEWKDHLRTDNNETAVYRGITGGTYVENTLHSRVYRGAITFENAIGALAELNSVLAVFEMEIDDTGKVHYGSWRLG